MIGFAVDEHEGLVGGQAAQQCRMDKGLAVGSRQALDVEGRQQLCQVVVHITRHAGPHQRLRKRVNRREGIVLRPAAFTGAGHDHLVLRRV